MGITKILKLERERELFRVTLIVNVFGDPVFCPRLVDQSSGIIMLKIDVHSVVREELGLAWQQPPLLSELF